MAFGWLFNGLCEDELTIQTGSYRVPHPLERHFETNATEILNSLSLERNEEMTFTLKEKDSDEMAISTTFYRQLAPPVLVG